MNDKAQSCPAVRVVMFPKDTNCHGNIFGGVILSHIDVAAGVAAKKVCKHRLVTVSMKEVVFKKPVHVGDVLTCWASVTAVGRTSISTHVIVEVERDGKFIQVTEAHVVYVAVDDQDKPLPIATGLIEGWQSNLACRGEEPPADTTSPKEGKSGCRSKESGNSASANTCTGKKSKKEKNRKKRK